MKRPNTSKTYPGINNDIEGGMSMVGKIILDARVFGILPETETCEGWDIGRLEAINQQVNDEWDKYSCMVSNLPEELRARHKQIYDQAIARAKEKGWNPEDATNKDD